MQASQLRKDSRAAAQVRRCLKCRRESTTLPYGPRCFVRVRAAAFSLINSRHPVAIRAGAALLRGMAIPILGRRGHYYFRSSEPGNPVIYLTTTKSCTCLAGQHDKMCYHRITAIILAA
jgi:hypothetical protein